ncbi:MAG: tRNA lysidine(34) synthetase TilS [Paludibacteraceae bacterium]|nr:tRNA lysidine(34) synthetase TilS [Paludibacteraceae bacterium]
MIDVSQLRFPFPTTTKLIVAVSGGADSVALLDILHQAGFPCVVAHCNFHLRGEESNRDENFVRSLANQYKLPFRKIDFHTLEYASMRSLSIEMAARELRYEWFRQLLIREGALKIAVAHHADDVIETFLMNLSRGTGLKGLTGIKELIGDVWRPLLSVSRKDITDYLQMRNLSHVEDSTNADTLYTRNKFRNEIIPMLQSVYPTFKNNLLNTIGYLKQTDDFLQQILTEKKQSLFHEISDNHFSISLDLLRKEKSIDFLLYELLSPYGFSSATIDDLVQSVASENPGNRFYNKKKSFVIIQERDALSIHPISVENQIEEYTIVSMDDFNSLPVSIQCTKKDVRDVEIVKSPNFCYIDASKLQFPLHLRRWRVGDCFVPFGMNGKKKLSDFFIDQKLSNEEKEKMWILLNQDTIVWIVGCRADNRFRITETTRDIYVLQVNNTGI